MPCCFTYLNPVSANPPWHPPVGLPQSTSCWSDNICKTPVEILDNPCKGPVVANTQAAAQFPWFLVGPTAPCWVQSISVAFTLYVS